MRRKIKQTPTPPKNPYDVNCFICNRGGTDLKYLGKDRWRHSYCNPGSPNWKEWYDLHPEEHTDAGDILRGS